MWEWSRTVAEHASAAAFTQPVAEPEPTFTEVAATAESGFTAEAAEGEIGGVSAMRRAARPGEYDLAG
ncbi:hypothetical protein [Nocardia cyriacigeorgica]|uniref:Uncharacterized protein n=1 Tax=Nocardia cyriacigeorgica (strain GUH-2) TaxID=1127134 RepID=H6R2L7_NOCCG|nr:hypothetical protein [Nocardia cyriacigeorgica]MBF6287006.1 hypothetical protein [Nocardia cyriacigeorgica]BDT85286.1 hypothetical protein FMUAM8_10500 [Nocardia cyriacigeorgica]CCF61867.1 protein of unknown function [Nocardia cyriacigeorgica GUH-2]